MSNKKPVVMYTIAMDEKYKECARKMVNSFKNFHPEIPVVVFDGTEFDAQSKGAVFGYNYAFFGEQLAKEYELVIHLDADCIVCGRFDEILNTDYEVYGALNFGDPYLDLYNERGKAIIPGISYDNYLTAGVVAARNPEFWTQWRKDSIEMGWSYQFIEQDSFNYIFQHGRYKTHVLDVEDFYYGNSVRLIYPELTLDGDTIMCRNRIVKNMHWAGGDKMAKLDYREQGVPEDVCKRLDYLIA